MDSQGTQIGTYERVAEHEDGHEGLGRLAHTVPSVAADISLQRMAHSCCRSCRGTSSGAGAEVKGDFFQVYAPMQNENVYTNSWTGPFYPCPALHCD